MLKTLQGIREKPIPDTPTEYVDLYTECWDGEPDKRPIMSEVVVRLKNILDAIDYTEIVQIHTADSSRSAGIDFSSDLLSKFVTSEVKLSINEIVITLRLNKENELIKNMNYITPNLPEIYNSLSKKSKQ
ncbi:unnamed protein product [Rhizophagus irregularis]|nr:unnamed protein product [Rhizophagus irregularis]